jgi:hypothetical protein
MVVSPAVSETMNDCAGNSQQQCTTQTGTVDVRKYLVGKHERKKQAGRIRYMYIYIYISIYMSG